MVGRFDLAISALATSTLSSTAQGNCATESYLFEGSCAFFSFLFGRISHCPSSSLQIQTSCKSTKFADSCRSFPLPRREI